MNDIRQRTNLSTADTAFGIASNYHDEGNAIAYPLLEDQSTNATLVWDRENRLIRPNNGGVIEYRYDSLSRRLTKATAAQFFTHLYDGWNCLAEHQENVLQHTYTWGKDLSGSMQGTGGVGGLLSQRDEFAAGDPAYYPTYDGNGNVSESLDSDRDVTAHFEYDAFGNITESSGAIECFDIRFSTKKRDAETGLYYYGYRYYDPVTGRWPSRDPIEESGGSNLYNFGPNSPINGCDVLGNWWHFLLNILKSPNFWKESINAVGAGVAGNAAYDALAEEDDPNSNTPTIIPPASPPKFDPSGNCSPGQGPIKHKIILPCERSCSCKLGGKLGCASGHKGEGFGYLSLNCELNSSGRYRWIAVQPAYLKNRSECSAVECGEAPGDSEDCYEVFVIWDDEFDVNSDCDIRPERKKYDWK